MRHFIMIKKLFHILLLFTIGLSGCSAKGNLESYNRENIDIGYVKAIVVLPFENNSADEYAPARIRNITMTQILADGLFDVVDKGVVDSHLHEEAISIGKPLDKPTLQRLGQHLNIQAVLLGTVDLSDEGRKGAVAYPELSITLRLIEVESGLIIWQASGSETGDSAWRRLFGLAMKDTFEVSLNLVNKMLSTIPR